MTLRQFEADSLARDYLPKDAVDRIQRNRERRVFRSLPEAYRDLGGISGTIIDGVRQSTDRELGRERSQTGAWIERWRIRLKAWHATNEIASDLRTRAGQRQHAEIEKARVISEIDELIDELTHRNERGLECLQLRQEYVAKIDQIGLSLPLRDEAIAALDAVIEYHLDVATGEGAQLGRQNGRR